MFLIDTNVVSEARKNRRANPGVTKIFASAAAENQAVYLSAISVGELRRGVELVRHRGDAEQAAQLEQWLDALLASFSENILPFDADAAQIWGRLRVPDASQEIDKQIAAIAMAHGLVVVTRNIQDFSGTGVKLLNPFET